MKNNKKILGIIPARGGSKRLPRKNILPMDGKPLLAYSIECALKAPSLDRIIVSTDDTEIADIARSFGAEVPFLRPAEIAVDKTETVDMFIRHAIDFFENKGEYFDYVINLRPTAPLREPEDIEKIIQTAIENDFDLVRSVTAVEGINHPCWMYKAGENGKLEPLFPEENISKYSRSTELPKGIHSINGTVDLLSISHLKNASHIYVSDNMGYIEIPRERVVDIDTKQDFDIAEIIVKNYKNKK